MPDPENSKATKPEDDEVEFPESEDGFIPLPDEADYSEDRDTETPAEESGDKEPEKKELRPFTLEDEQPAETDGTPSESKEGEEGDLIEIVHQGQAHRFTKNKIIELAQKGFDYDVKVGPHGKIARMIEMNPRIAETVQQMWDKEYGQGDLPAFLNVGGDEGDQPRTTEKPPGEKKVEDLAVEIKPMDDYETETEWLLDNIKPVVAAINALQQKPSTVITQPSNQPNQPGVGEMILMGHDPQNYERLLPRYPFYMNQLTIGQIKAVNSSPKALCKFHDWVKECEDVSANMNRSAPSNARRNVPRPSFRVRSTANEAPRKEEDANFAWNLSNKDFDKQLARAKGFV